MATWILGRALIPYGVSLKLKGQSNPFPIQLSDTFVWVTSSHSGCKCLLDCLEFCRSVLGEVMGAQKAELSHSQSSPQHSLTNKDTSLTTIVRLFSSENYRYPYPLD